MMMKHPLPPLGAWVATLALAGCSTPPPAPHAAARVEQMTRERTGHAPVAARDERAAARARERSAQLLAQPLTADAAVELALLNHRGLQARLEGLALAEAQQQQGSRPANPSFTIGRSSGGGVVERERSLVADVLGLLSLPLRRRLEQSRFEAVQLRTAYEAVGAAAQARRAFYAAVAAQELARHARTVKDVADTAGELARRMEQAGNFSKLAHLREQAFHASATGQLARAEHQLVAERERLARALGLDGIEALPALPERLPPLPAQPIELRDVEQAAIDQRLDVALARHGTQETARSLGLTRATRFVNVLHVGAGDVRETGEPRRTGWEIGFELPLFDFGTARVAQAEATYRQALHQAAQVAIDARSQVREAWSAYRTALALARHHQEHLLPMRRRISEENLLRYNGMLIGVFDLLADARDQVSAVTESIQAQRDFWIADTDLQAALNGVPAGPSPSSLPAAGPDAGRAAH